MSGLSWSKEEQIIVLYYYLVKGAKGYESDNLVQKLASLIPRHSAASIAMKIGNYTYLNTNKEGGLKHISKLDGEIWQQFNQNLINLELVANELLTTSHYKN
ncbi:MAG: hypothetical protein RBR97_14865 [Bacteroidales bacterium]|nr:hypothetical protein [Bacteroidales bacterium]